MPAGVIAGNAYYTMHAIYHKHILCSLDMLRKEEYV